MIKDNNFFGLDHWREIIDWLRRKNQPVNFQGIDVRDLTPEKCKELANLCFSKQAKIAWDNPRENIESKLKEITKYIKPYRLMCYVFIAYWSTQIEDLYRVETLRNLGIDPFVMPYDRSELYQRTFARWVNHKAIFKKVSWKDYQRRVYKQETAGTGWFK